MDTERRPRRIAVSLKPGDSLVTVELGGTDVQEGERIEFVEASVLAAVEKERAGWQATVREQEAVIRENGEARERAERERDELRETLGKIANHRPVTASYAPDETTQALARSALSPSGGNDE